MNNVLNIVVFKCQRINNPEDDTVAVIASDNYADAVLTFDDLDHLYRCYHSKEDLILAVLQMSAFEGGASILEDGTYELDAFSDINVEGYPQ